MKFIKMHGIGNDYVYVDCTKKMIDNPSEISKFVSDRHKGIGSDGLILIAKSKVADFKMIMYNADGSQGEMCGNGIRCVGKFIFDNNLSNKKELKIETLGGIKYLYLNVVDNKVESVRVNMGEPIFRGQSIPSTIDKEEVIDYPLVVDNKEYKVSLVSMGNPHCVIFLEEDIHKLSLEKIGPYFERNKIFPNRINTEFINVISRSEIDFRVWERGSGETFACGTGACASVSAGIKKGILDKKVLVHLLGGDLIIEWAGEGEPLFMTGEASTVFYGEINL